MKTTILVLAVTALVVLAGCNPQAEPEVVANDFCGSLQAFGAALAQIEQISATSAVDDLRAARLVLVANQERLLQAAEGLTAARTDAIVDAWDSLGTTVDSVTSSELLAEKAGAILADAASVRAAYGQLALAACPELALAGDEETLVPVDVREPELTAEGAPGDPKAGTYGGEVAALDGSQQRVTLTLHPDGAAAIVFDGAPARDGSEQAVSEVILEGTWEENVDGTVSVTLDRLAEGVQLAVAEAFKFSRQDGSLVAVEFDTQVYGPAGLTLQRIDAAVGDGQPAAARPETGQEAAGEDAAAAPAGPASVGPAGLTGTTWQLQQIQQTGATRDVPDPGRYTLTLSPDGSVVAVADCNQGSGVFEAASGSIRFQIDWSAAVCPSSLYRQFMKYLEYADAYTVDGEVLSIGYSNGSGTLIFGFAGE